MEASFGLFHKVTWPGSFLAHAPGNHKQNLTMSNFVTPRTAACQAPLSSTISWSLLEFMSTESVMLSNNLILYRPLLFVPSIVPSIRVFSNELALRTGGQSIGASSSVLPMNIQDWFPLEWTGWISLQSKGFSRIFSNTTVWKHQIFGAQLSLYSNSHIHTWLLEKIIALTRWTFVRRVMSLHFNALSKLVIAFLPRSKRLLISWLASTIHGDFGAPKNKVPHCIHLLLIHLPWSGSTGCRDLSIF